MHHQCQIRTGAGRKANPDGAEGRAFGRLRVRIAVQVGCADVQVECE